MEKEMNLEELAEQATPLAATDSDVTNIEDDAPEEDDGLIISDEDTNEPEKKEEYTGSGVVIDKPEKNHNSQGNVVIGPLANKERNDDIARTMNELDEEIAEAKKIHDKIKEKEASGEKVEKINNNPEDESKEEAKDNSDSDVKILIDKIGMGTVTFTDEEKKRIRFSKKIDLVEVDTRELESIKVKKVMKTPKDFSILQRNFNKAYSPIVALASGYTCKMKNLSAAEVMNLYQPLGSDTANSWADRWSIIYDKIVDPSIGDFKDFEDFCNKTAFTDYPMFVYGLLVSSYPEETTRSFNCTNDKCTGKPENKDDKTFETKFNNRQMFRADEMTDKQKEIFSDIIHAAGNYVDAKAYAETKALVNQVKRVRLDKEYGVIADIYVPSISESIQRVHRNMRPEFTDTDTSRVLFTIAQNIKSILIPDFDDPEGKSYYEVSEIDAVMKVMNNFSTIQLTNAMNLVQKINEITTLKFGIANVECPYCHQKYSAVDIDPSEELFRRVQDQMMFLSE